MDGVADGYEEAEDGGEDSAEVDQLAALDHLHQPHPDEAGRHLHGVDDQRGQVGVG